VIFCVNVRNFSPLSEPSTAATSVTTIPVNSGAEVPIDGIFDDDVPISEEHQMILERMHNG
jgi:hypothetical protein